MGERPRRILSIDGGGVRGVIPAVAIAALERQTGTPARDQFDFVAGTSTGALVAGAVAAGIPGEQIVALYLDRAPEIFRKVPVLSTLARIVSGRMYDVGRLHDLIRSELGEQAASWRLADVPVDILVTAKGLVDSHQWYFVKDCHGRNTCRTGALSLADCLTASAAAPTYFAPWVIPGLADRGPMIDGGTGVAGNPTYQACVEAFEYADGYRPDETVVVSLGTGHFLRRGQPRWLYDWLGWLLAELLRSPGEQQTELVSRHYAAAAFYRIDVRLDRDYPLDGVSEMEALRRIGERLAARVSWAGILDGTETMWRVTAANRRPEAYAADV
jgi:predicted acylesterase/phospholipase RssA